MAASEALDRAAEPDHGARAGGWLGLSPLNQRRLANFKANRRGYWALWIFLALFVLSLGAEMLANDRPILIRFKGEFYSPLVTDYPEETFLGEDGFLPTTDYKIIEITQAIEANGWAIWPPIRYSYRTVNNEIPEPAPSKLSWLYAQAERCANYPLGAEDPACNLGNWNWLGTDDQARDVMARAIYGFRISVLFGLILTAASALIGVTAGAVQGYFGGWIDLLFQRFIEIWSSMPTLYILLIIAAVLPPGFVPAREEPAMRRRLPNALVLVRIALIPIIIGLVLAASSLWLFDVEVMQNEGGVNNLRLRGFSAGFYVWWVALLAPVGFSIAGWVRDRRFVRGPLPDGR